MTSRFISNLLVAVFATVQLVACFAFPPAVTGWLGFGTSCATVVTVLIAFAFRGRGPAQRGLDLVVLLIGVWTLIATRAYAGETVKWVSFSGGAAVWGLAMAGLVVHELGAERIVGTVVSLPHDGARQAALRDQRQRAAS